MVYGVDKETVVVEIEPVPNLYVEGPEPVSIAGHAD